MVDFFGFSNTSLTTVTIEEKRELSLANSLPSTSDCNIMWVEWEAASRKSVNTLQEGQAQAY
jgi:hypothetical protein